MSFKFEQLAIPDIVLVRGPRHHDARGWFAETYKRSEFVSHGIPDAFTQDNHSFSEAKGTLRGLHYQRQPHAQGKLVRCIQGAVFDVAVDIRAGSATCGRWLGVELRSDEGALLWIPVGFAHGFQTLEPGTQVLYQTTAEYAPATEGGIRWDDPNLAIAWPIKQPIVSARDAALPVWDPRLPPFVA